MQWNEISPVPAPGAVLLAELSVCEPISTGLALLALEGYDDALELTVIATFPSLLEPHAQRIPIDQRGEVNVASDLEQFERDGVIRAWAPIGTERVDLGRLIFLTDRQAEAFVLGLKAGVAAAAAAGR